MPKQRVRSAKPAPKPKPKRQTDEEKKQKKANQRLLSGKDTLEYVEIDVDDDIYCQEYLEKIASGGVKRESIRKKCNDVSCTVRWWVTTWSHTPDPSSKNRLACTPLRHCINLVALIIRRGVLLHVGDKLTDFVKEATATCRAIVIFEGTSTGKTSLNVLSCPNILSIKRFPNKSNTAAFLSSLTHYVSKAPYKIHNFTPFKGYSESDPFRVFRRMLSQVPGLGAKAIDAITAKYPTVSQLLVKYRSSDDEDFCRLLLSEIRVSPTQKIGLAASTSVYNSLVLGIL